MKLHDATTPNTPELNPIAPTARNLEEDAIESRHSKVQLKAVPPYGHTASEPLYDDIDVRPSTILRALQKGLDVPFVHLIKKIATLAVDGLQSGVTVNSTKLCAEIRYGLQGDAYVGRCNVPGLSKGERLDAGKVIWLLADAGELPLKSLGTNKANLQQYRVN